jgi:DNA-binding transcriptional MerR regulator
MRQMLRIGELSELAGTTSNAVRFYHKAGLLKEPERSEAGYRLYGEADLVSLGRILRLRSLGLSVPQIRYILNSRSSDEASALKEALESKLEDLSSQMVELDTAKERIEETLQAGDFGQLLDGAPHSGQSLPEELADVFQDAKTSENDKANVYEHKLGAILSAFRWPTRYMGLLRDVLQAEMPNEISSETERRTEEIAERWSALYERPEDDPEVERLVEDYLRYEQEHPLSEEQLNQWWEKVLRRNRIPPGDPILRMAVGLIRKSFSPAQRRYGELLRERKRELYGKEKNSGFMAESLQCWIDGRAPGGDTPTSGASRSRS